MENPEYTREFTVRITQDQWKALTRRLAKELDEAGKPYPQTATGWLRLAINCDVYSVIMN